MITLNWEGGLGISCPAPSVRTLPVGVAREVLTLVLTISSSMLAKVSYQALAYGPLCLPGDLAAYVVLPLGQPLSLHNDLETYARQLFYRCLHLYLSSGSGPKCIELAPPTV